MGTFRLLALGNVKQTVAFIYTTVSRKIKSAITGRKMFKFPRLFLTEPP
jgi:hypothetical protein